MRRIRWDTGLELLVAAALAIPLLAARPPWIADSRPAAGRMLIATHQVGGPFFSQSIVILIDHGPEGAVGLILNRPSSLDVGTLLPDLEKARIGRGRVHLGGPVSQGTVLLLFHSAADETPPDSRRVLPNVYASGSGALRHLLPSDPPADQVRAYVGYAGWAAGQLEAEIARGDWIVVPGSAELVFHARPETLWPALIAKHGGIRADATAHGLSGSSASALRGATARAAHGRVWVICQIPTGAGGGEDEP